MCAALIVGSDVYDALRSERVYRPAWQSEEALALLRRETGTAFDPRCVEALVQVLGGNVAPLRLHPPEAPLARTG